jgi:hypothetical protein
MIMSFSGEIFAAGRHIYANQQLFFQSISGLLGLCSSVS